MKWYRDEADNRQLSTESPFPVKAIKAGSHRDHRGHREDQKSGEKADLVKAVKALTQRRPVGRPHIPSLDIARDPEQMKCVEGQGAAEKGEKASTLPHLNS